MKRVPISLVGSLALLAAGCTATPPAPLVPPASVVRAIPPAVQAPSGLDDGAFEAWLTTERTRVTQSRAAAHQTFSEAETACWRRFAVNDCVSNARADRRKVLASLRDEELGLNLQERQRNTAAKLKQLNDTQGAPDPGK